MQQTNITVTNAAIILSTESFFGRLLSVLFLHEVSSTCMVMGAVLIMGAILIAEVKPSLHILKAHYE